MSLIAHEMNQISRSDAWNGYLSLADARSLRDLAASLGAGLPKYLLAPEVAVLLSYFDDLRQRTYFDTVWNTGARLNEALALRPADFISESGKPVVVLRTLKQRGREASRKPGRPKVNDETPPADPRYVKPPEPAVRLVPVLDTAYEQRIKEYIATWKPRVKHQPFWEVASRQTPINWLTAAVTRAERDGVMFSIPITPHTLRHSFAMHLKMHGLPDMILQSLMGHRYARSTEVYSRVMALDVLAGRRLDFTLDVSTARRLLLNRE